ncbi:hypothetical protein BU26DRAFT_326033 [Trematosphaeria pertusa]|uniref:Uncharacterized protein n=1 Tax=Trematosphaeria pertusa TaxID=390896 RepID=A0A6A6IES1_9PLEO|nr:uncharacterized protein BU26DRAFT_326033 [Trematosphaeria pertusa]KAF2248040.1 hypothetical protein BU26DRAFT_326033 [Trematosphaeria pertusa]
MLSPTICVSMGRHVSSAEWSLPDRRHFEHFSPAFIALLIYAHCHSTGSCAVLLLLRPARIARSLLIPQSASAFHLAMQTPTRAPGYPRK